MSEDIHEKEIELLRKVLSDNYHDIEFFKQGGTRRLYSAKWGPADEEVVIKIDKDELESPRAKRHVERGCDTRNDVLALAQIRKIENPELHSINRLNDFIVLEDGRVVSVESKFDNVPNLEELVKEKGPLKVGDFEKAFTQVLEAERYLINEAGLYHRDNKPSNILVGEDNQVRLTDLANACRKDHPEVKAMPTAGGHFILDPLLADNKYNEQTELFAVGVDMYYSLAGKYIFEYDEDKGTAVDFKGRSLLDKDGNKDKKKHEQALEEALAELPNGAGKYSKIIRRLLTTDEKSRYKSIDDLVKDFERAKKPHWLRRIFSTPVLTAVLLSTLALGSIAGLIGYKVNKNLETAIEDSKKYEVIAAWDDLDIRNNLVQLGVNVNANHEHATKDYPERRFLCYNPGEELKVTVKAEAIIDPTRWTYSYTLPGKVYIEGFPGKTFQIDPEPPNFEGDEFSGMTGFSWVTSKIPEDIQEGTYVLAAELYSPEGMQELVDEKIKFPPAGTVIARKRIPIVIGNPENKIYLVGLMFRISEYIDTDNLSRPDFRNKPEITYELSIPGSNFRQTLSDRDNWSRFRLPKITHTYQRTLQIVFKDNDKIIGYTFIPFKAEEISKGNYPWYNFSIPTGEFSETLERYRRVLNDSHNQSR